MARTTQIKQHRRKGKPVKAHKRRIKGKDKIKKRRLPISYPGKRMVLTDEEREYIIEMYDEEPENLPYYEVEDAIDERREISD